MEKVIISTSDIETKSIASELVSDLTTGGTICLRGDLAAGKTTFSQGIAGFLGISRLTSPTFIIMREYPVENHSIIKRLYHLDLYRISSSDEIKSFDLEEITSNNSNLVLIEWPERIEDILPKNRLEVSLKITSDNEREINIKKHK